MKLLDIGVEEGGGGVRFVGIHGMAGVGKTTLAQVISHMVSPQFEVSCFLSCKEKDDQDTSGYMRRIDRSLNALQNKLISKILMGEEINRMDDCDRVCVISSRVRQRKVFLVLDDVDSEEQIEALAWSSDLFGEGSRIILTGRDAHFLNRHATASAIYEVKLLNDNEALQLFCWYAFRQPYPTEDSEKVSLEFVTYAQGLPLGLKGFGRSVHQRSLYECKARLEKLRVTSSWLSTIESPLELCLSKLDDVEKELFLDIACFFKESDLVSITHKLESFGYFPNASIATLRDNSLINTSRGILSMHGLIVKWGQEIVHGKSPMEPGKRSRLWHWEDVLHVLQNNTGTAEVQGMVLDFPNNWKGKRLRLHVDGFSNMTRLRMLKIGKIGCVENVSELYAKLSTLVWRGKLSKFVLPDELRIIEWCGCPLKSLPYPLQSLPAEFEPVKLVELSMPFSPIKQLWTGDNKSLEDLKIINLRGSQHLIEIPDFTEIPNLQRLELEGCTNLSKVHPSIGFLKCLKRLNLRNCKSLKSLPDMVNLESLEFFNLSGCSRLKAFPAIRGNMTSLWILKLDETAIEELPLSFEGLSGLQTLSLDNCRNISSFPSVISRLSSLEILVLSHCSRLFEPDKTAITQLLPKSCKDLSFHCHLLPKESLDPNTYLLLNSLSDLSSLIFLDLSYCNLSDGAIPNDLGHLSSLEIVNLSGNKFARIPDSICQLSNLESLYLRNCSRLQALPKLPLSLIYLYVENCPLLEMFSDQTYLRTLSDILTITDCSLAALYIDYDGGSPCNILQLDLRRHLQTEGYWRRFFGTKVICGSWLGPGIPKWFNNKSASSSVKLEMHPDLNDNREWKGCALFVVYEVHEHEKSNSMIFESTDHPTLHHFDYHFGTDKGRLDIPFLLPVPKVTSVGATGFWVYIPAKCFLEQSNKLDGCSYIEALILSDSLVVEVKECGMRLVCSEHDALEFYEALNIIGHGLDLETYHPPLYRL
ncbi:TMV resistance protein N-like [Corylus avellana]|uniref:TMV resistance protein N-like n=1 Tax=Corylus avellana TaxID=13451 RepID=UPI00286CEF22|nr:TMV resistance protein N-like [Corylus avellana]